MLAYRTLLNELIDGANLSSRDYHFLGRLHSLISVATAAAPREVLHRDASTARKAADRFLDDSLAEFRRVFPTPPEYRQALSGPLGTVICDGWFRVYLKYLAEAQRPAALEQFRFNSGRAFFEWYLRAGQNQKEYAREAGFHDSTLSRAFGSLLAPEGDHATGKPHRGFSLRGLQKACRKLQVAPRLLPVGPSSDQVPEVLAEPPPGAVTTRERHLWALGAIVGRALYGSGRLDRHLLSDCQRLIAVHVSYLYSIREPGALNRVSSALLKDLLAPPLLTTPSAEDRDALDVFEPGLRRRGPLQIMSWPDRVGRKSRLLLWHARYTPTVLSPPPQYDPPKDRWEAEAERKLLDLSRVAWTKSEDACLKLVESGVLTEAVAETFETVHPDVGRVIDRVIERGDQVWEQDPALDWHIRHCSECHDKLLGGLARAERSGVMKDIRFRIFGSRDEMRAHHKKYAKPMTAGEAPEGLGPRVIDYHPDSPSPVTADARDRGPRVGLQEEPDGNSRPELARGRLADPALHYALDWVVEGLDVRVWAEPNRVIFAPQFIQCVFRDRLGTPLLVQHFLVIKRGPRSEVHLGACRFLRSDLERLIPPNHPDNQPLEFPHPELTIINDHTYKYIKNEAEIEDLVRSLTLGFWDDATLQDWRRFQRSMEKWRDAGPGPDIGVEGVKVDLERLLEWKNKLVRRLSWHAIRSMNRSLDAGRRELLAVAEGRINRGQSSQLGKHPAPNNARPSPSWGADPGASRAPKRSSPLDARPEGCSEENWHSWIYIRERRGDRPETEREWYVAQWTHNTEAASWILLSRYPSIVRHCFRQPGGYMTNDSRTDGEYWDWSPPDRGRSALAAPVVRPGLLGATVPGADGAYGVIILESDRPKSFHAAQVVDLEADARGLYFDLRAWQHLREPGACPWQPYRQVRDEGDTSWHMIGRLEEICDAIAAGIAERGAFCSIWYLDWKREGAEERDHGRTFLLASNGYAQHYRLISRRLDRTKGQQQGCAVFVDASAGRRDDDSDQVWNADLKEAFADLASKGLLHGARMVPMRWGDCQRPNCLLMVHCSEHVHVPRYDSDPKSPEEECRRHLPGYEELEELAGQLGETLKRFLAVRREMGRAWVAQQLSHGPKGFSKFGTSPGASWKPMLALLRDVFEASDGSIYVWKPNDGHGAFECLASTEENWPEGIDHLNAVAARLHERIPAGERTLRLYESHDKIDVPCSKKLGRPAPFAGTRVLACRIADEGTGEPILLLDLRRSLQDRPFTGFTEDLASEIMQECREIFRIQKKLWEFRGRPEASQRLGASLDRVDEGLGLGKACFPILSIPTLAGLILQALAMRVIEAPSSSTEAVECGAKLEFKADDESDYVLYCEKPDRAFRDEDDDDSPPAPARAGIGTRLVQQEFHAWVRGRLARGRITVYGREEEVGKDMERAAEYLTAVFSKENGQCDRGDRPPITDLAFELLFRHCDDGVAGAIPNAECRGVLEEQIRREFGPVAEFRVETAFAGLRSGEALLSSLADDEDRALFADFDQYRVRIDWPRGRVVIPLRRYDRPVIDLSFVLDEAAKKTYAIPRRSPVARDASEPLAYERSHKLDRGTALERWGGAVGRIAGLWHALNLFRWGELASPAANEPAKAANPGARSCN